MSRAERSNSESHHTTSIETETDDSDLPLGSIVVPITENTPWQYSAYDSGESAREITNPKSHSNMCPWSKPGPTSSQVAATNLNATARSPFISFPGKLRLPSFAHHQSPPSIFPRWRTGRLKKSGLAYSEPGSPKVSCWGNVLSEREKEKLRKREKQKQLEKAPSCCSNFSVVLTCVGDRAAGRRAESHFQLAEVHPLHVEEVRSPERNIVSEVNEVAQLSVETEAEVVRLGKLKRFSSGRRTESWGADLMDEEGIVVAAQENSSNLVSGSHCPDMVEVFLG